MNIQNKFSSLLRNFLFEKVVYGLNADDPKLLSAHRFVLSNKKVLQDVFLDFYTIIKNEIGTDYLDKVIIEFGSGSGFSKQSIPNVITSDVRFSDNIDLIIDAQDTDFNSAYFDAIFAINVFHHIPDPSLFIFECERILKDNGVVILIEPNWNWFSKLIHQNLHNSETFNMDDISWVNSAIKGPLSGANQALAFNVFERDRLLFINKFKFLNIYKIYSVNNGLRYLFSGGVNYKQILPNFVFDCIRYCERFLGFFSLHRVYVLKKNVK